MVIIFQLGFLIFQSLNMSRGMIDRRLGQLPRLIMDSLRLRNHVQVAWVMLRNKEYGVLLLFKLFIYPIVY